MSEENWVIKLTSEFNEDYYDHVSERNEFPEQYWNALGEKNKFGLLVSRRNGGSEIGFTEFIQNTLDVSSRAGTLAYYFVAQNLSAKLFDDFGTEKLRALIPKVISGESKVNLALTEEQSGADAQSIRTKAVLGKDGKYAVTGDKYCVTNGNGPRIPAPLQRFVQRGRGGQGLGAGGNRQGMVIPLKNIRC